MSMAGMPWWLWVLGALIGISIPLAIQHIIEPYAYRRGVERNRRDLANAGLTPERYLATISMTDSARRAAAMLRFGLGES